MPGLGLPFVREMRRFAAAHAAFPGTPPRDPAELLGVVRRAEHAGRG